MQKEIEEIMQKYEYALDLLKVELGILIKEYSKDKKYDPVEHLETRIKSIESINSKLERKGYEFNAYNIVNHVHDVVGIRIICSFLSDVYDIVNLIKNFREIEIVSEKNYITNPKKSGYTSYHLIVKVPLHLDESVEMVDAEIQVRTVAMDFWASLEHKIQYKFKGIIPEEVSDELFNCSIDIKNLDSKMEELNKIVNKYN